MPCACAQVGNQTIDHLYWGRPEDITPTTYGARLVYVVDPTHPAADVVGAAAAALAATAQAGARDMRKSAYTCTGDLFHVHSEDSRLNASAGAKHIPQLLHRRRGVGTRMYQPLDCSGEHSSLLQLNFKSCHAMLAMQCFILRP